MSYTDTDYDPLFLERREIIRSKNDYYDNRKKFLEERPKLIKELADMGIKITDHKGKEIGKPSDKEVEKLLKKEKEKGIQGYLLNIK